MLNLNILTIMLIFLPIYICTVTEIPLYNLTGTVPANVFQVPLDINQKLNATKLWSTGSDSIFLYLYQSGSDLVKRAGYVQYKPTQLIYTSTVKLLYYLRIDCNKPVVGYKINININGTDKGIFYGICYKQYSIALINFPLKIDPSMLSVGCYFKVKINNTIYTKQFVCADCLQPNKNETFNLTALQTEVTTQIKNQNISLPLNYYINGPTTTTSFIGFQILVSTFSDRPCMKPCAGTLGIYPGTFDTCICYDYQIWNSANKICMINCSMIQYATTSSSGVSCNCQTDFIWDSGTNKCIIYCNLKTNAVTLVPNTIDQCTCTSPYIWNTTTFTCYIPCQTITYASYIANNNNACSCSSPYIWNQTRKDCSLNCSSILYAYELVINKIDQCTCSNGKFLWNSGMVKCVIDCTNIANAASRVTNKIDQCTCDSNYLWNTGMLKCVSSTIDCSQYPHSNGPKSGSTTECQCISGYVWMNGACLIDCSIITNTNGILEGSMDQCKCIIGFVWIGADSKCKIMCEGIMYTAGAFVGSYDTCLCVDLFRWDSGNFACKINCNMIQNATTLVTGSIDACNCLNLYDKWSSTTRSCTYDCLTIAQSDSFSKSLYKTLAKKNVCTECTHNCLICSQSNHNTCYRCKRPYSKYTDNGTCYRCGQDLCIRCDISNKNVCIQCQQGSLLDSAGKCYLCPARCLSCNGKTCIACFQGAVLVAGTCKPCTDQGCIQCVGNQLNKCLTCKQGFYLHGPSQKCKKCKKGCNKCNANGCLQVMQGLVILANDSIVACKPGCQCSTNAPDSCNTCQVSKYVTFNGLCKSCQLGCQTCSSSTVCTNCLMGYQLQNDDCLKCQDNCLACNPLNTQKCLSCKRGFSLVVDSCQLTCGVGCLECDINNVNLCYQCDRGYVLNQETKQCMKCFSNCLGTCDAANVTVCLGCSNGFELIENKCVRCPSNCFSCLNGNCIQAIAAFNLVQNDQGTIPLYVPSQKCDYPCATCLGNVCSSCQIGFIFDSTTHTCSIDSSCNPTCSYFPPGSQQITPAGTIATCPSNCASCKSGTCIQCQKTYYLDAGVCNKCPSKCKTCYDQQTCQECVPGYIKQIIKTNSYIGQDYQSYQIRSDTCIPCSANCLTCGTDANLCMSCDVDHVLVDDRCAKKYFVTFAVQLTTSYDSFIGSAQSQDFINALAIQANVSANYVQLTYISSDPTIIGGKILIPQTVLGDGQVQSQQILTQLAQISQNIGQFAINQLKSSVRQGDYQQDQLILKTNNQIVPVQQNTPSTNQMIYIAVGGGIGALVLTGVIVKTIMAKIAGGAAQLSKVIPQGLTKINQTRVQKINDSLGDSMGESMGQDQINQDLRTNNRLTDQRIQSIKSEIKSKFKPKIDRSGSIYMKSLKIHDITLTQ